MNFVLVQAGVRDQSNVMYNSALAVIFGVKKYAQSLWKVVERKGIQVNLHHNLLEVVPKERKAIFMVSNPEDGTVQNKTFHVCMYVCMHACMHVCVCVCTYAC